MILRFREFNEAARESRDRIDLRTARSAFHWVNEGNLFDQLYDVVDTMPYVLREDMDGESLEMPPLPRVKLTLGDPGISISSDHSVLDGVCMTLDPGYIQAGFTGESNICLVFDLQGLMRDFDVIDLTDNGESEVRVAGIPEFDKYLRQIYVTREVWEDGAEWEDFRYRAVDRWFPDRLRGFVIVKDTAEAIGAELAKHA